MRRFYVVLILGFLSVSYVHGQTYYAKTGSVSFVSEASIEKIEANSNSGYVVLDAGSGQLEWSVLIKSFRFEKSLMQDHFNENYMESDKYPKAIFKGKIDNPASVNLSTDGEYPVNVRGQMIMHGITKPFITKGLIAVKSGKVTASGIFDITIADYAIKVPKVVRGNIAETVQVLVEAELLPLK